MLFTKDLLFFRPSQKSAAFFSLVWPDRKEKKRPSLFALFSLIRRNTFSTTYCPLDQMAVLQRIAQLLLLSWLAMQLLDAAFVPKQESSPKEWTVKKMMKFVRHPASAEPTASGTRQDMTATHILPHRPKSAGVVLDTSTACTICFILSLHNLQKC